MKMSKLIVVFLFMTVSFSESDSTVKQKTLIEIRVVHIECPTCSTVYKQECRSYQTTPCENFKEKLIIIPDILIEDEIILMENALLQPDQQFHSRTFSIVTSDYTQLKIIYEFGSRKEEWQTIQPYFYGEYQFHRERGDKKFAHLTGYIGIWPYQPSQKLKKLMLHFMGYLPTGPEGTNDIIGGQDSESTLEDFDFSMDVKYSNVEKNIPIYTRKITDVMDDENFIVDLPTKTGSRGVVVLTIKNNEDPENIIDIVYINTFNDYSSMKLSSAIGIYKRFRVFYSFTFLCVNLFGDYCDHDASEIWQEGAIDESLSLSKDSGAKMETFTKGKLPCSTKKCKNGGKCLNIESTAICLCPRGYIGAYCEIVDCLNTCYMGTCVSGKCVCSSNYTGIMCEISSCTSKEEESCLHGSKCMKFRRKIKCKCMPNTYGANCEHVFCKDRCVYGTCQMAIGKGAIEYCTCFDGFMGENCDLPFSHEYFLIFNFIDPSFCVVLIVVLAIFLHIYLKSIYLVTKISNFISMQFDKLTEVYAEIHNSLKMSNR